MSTKAKSRWANDEEDVRLEAQKKKEKEEKKRAKVEKQRALEEAERRRQEELAANSTHNGPTSEDRSSDRPTKRRRLSNEEHKQTTVVDDEANILEFLTAHWGPCRHVDNFEKLNHIEEGSYGWVSRAKEITTGEIVALKKLKMDNIPDGFPVTGLREIQTLMESRHPNIVYLREVVMGDTMSE